MLHRQWRGAVKRQSESFDRILEKKFSEGKKWTKILSWNLFEFSAVNGKWSEMKCELRMKRKMDGNRNNYWKGRKWSEKLYDTTTRCYLLQNIQNFNINVKVQFLVFGTFSIMIEWVLSWSGIQLRFSNFPSFTMNLIECKFNEWKFEFFCGTAIPEFT